MKVKELRDILGSFPQDMEVVQMESPYEDFAMVVNAGDVSVRRVRLLRDGATVYEYAVRLG